ncbi:hypothetical protein LZ31DRAFT_550006 [Colletotrichum somersetense]|nr:hypothetical protein LZ31DRAFT_550006 [Colletotrichum somersetense]
MVRLGPGNVISGYGRRPVERPSDSCPCDLIWIGSEPQLKEIGGHPQLTISRQGAGYTGEARSNVTAPTTNGDQWSRDRNEPDQHPLGRGGRPAAWPSLRGQHTQRRPGLPWDHSSAPQQLNESGFNDRWDRVDSCQPASFEVGPRLGSSRKPARCSPTGGKVPPARRVCAVPEVRGF